jgi:glutamate racemase
VVARALPEELRRRPVGVFDSGVGGLTVLHELLVQLPHEDFVYLADAARFPYGDRSQAQLEAFALEVAEELIARRIKLLVVACNSATAAALPALRSRLMETTLGVDVLGVVQPGAVQAVAATRNGRVGLLATPATVAEWRLRARDPGRGSVRRRHRGRVPRPDRDHRGRLPVRPPRGGHGARVLRARCARPASTP